MLTDYEYRYRITGESFISPIQCNTGNSTDNGDGTITITDIPDENIAEGDFQVRKRALGINPPSDWLSSDADFTQSGSGVEPNLVVSDVPDTSVGDKIYTDYKSNSDGAISFSSSNPSIATVSDLDGYLEITAIALGDFNIIANQAASGSFSGKIVNTPVTVVAKTSDNTTVYADYPTGLAAVSNGDEFAVLNEEGSSKKIYLKDSGEGIYLRTTPIASLVSVDTVSRALDEDFYGIMPLSPLFDIDSVFSLYHINKLKSVGDNSYIDNSLISEPNVNGYSEQGSVSITRNEYFGGKIKSFNVVFPAVSDALFAPFLHLLPHEFVIPEGQWTVQVDVKVPDGSPSKTIYYNNAFDGTVSSYKPHLITDEFTTIVFDKIHYNTPTAQSFYPFILTTGNTSSGTTTEVIELEIKNYRLVPGVTIQTVDNTSDKSLSMYNPLQYISNGNENLLFSFQNLTTYNGVNSSLLSRISRLTTEDEASILLVMKISDAIDYIYAIASDSINYALSDVTEGKINTDRLFDGISQKGFLLNDNQYHIVIITRSITSVSIYIDGILIAFKLLSLTPFPIKQLQLFGLENTSLDFDGIMSSVTFWDEYLDENNVLIATEIARKRLLCKGELIVKQTDFYISEGDSITWMPNSYQFLLRNEYSPKLQGSCPAESGSLLGNSSQSLPTNTVFARKLWVKSVAQSQLDEGKNVLMTIDIGSNDLFTELINSGAVISWYNRYMEYVAEFRDMGVKVAVCTIMDVEAITDKTFLIQANNLLRSDSSKYDGIIDFYASPLLTPVTPEYFYDGQHPTDLGFETMRDIAKPVLDTLIS